MNRHELVSYLSDNGISWFTPSAKSLYTTEVSFRLVESLNKMLVPVVYNNRTPKYHINFSSPEEFQYGNDCNIGYTYDTLLGHTPERKIEYLNRCDAVWVTSEFVKKVYTDNDIQQDVHVLPHGVSLDWDVVDREILDHFYFLLDNGGDVRFDLVYKTIDAFLKADLPCNVKLIVKTTTDIDTSQIRGEGWYDKRVILVDNFLPLEQYQRLYYKSNALLYPSNGEGFGLVPYQAVATGMPTITTHLTGCAGYSEHAIHWKHNWEGLGELIEPDYEALPELLHEVYENYHQHRQNAAHSARIIRASSSWDDICDRMISLLELVN